MTTPVVLITGALTGIGRATAKAALVSGVPMKRIGTPEDIAQAIVFVASDKASFITGASLAVDSGKLAR